MVKRPYPPGRRGKKSIRSISEYGKELKEKQKLKNWYNLRERQFRNYVKEVLGKRGKVEDAATILIRILESRLDNVIFRFGISSSRARARQLVSHGHFLINGRLVNIPSYSVKKGDKVSIKPSSIKKSAFQNLPTLLKKHQPPSWLSFNIDKLEGSVIGEPSFVEAAPPVEVSSIFEFYSK